MVREPAESQCWGMTSTPPPAPEQDAPHHGGPRVSHEEMRDLARLRRSTTDRKVAGVAGGLGRHFDIDPTIIRVAFVVLAIFGGAGLLLYGVCWLLVPEDGQDRARIDLEPSARGIVLIAFAAVAALMMIGDSWGVFGFPWPLAVLGVVVLAVMLSRKDNRPGTVSLSKDAPPPPPPYGTWQPPVPPVPPGPRPYRGPSLFWPTVALVALALGSLQLVELAGTSVPNAAYPALMLAICGGAMIVGAWFGRAGGVLFLAMLAGIGFGIAAASEHNIGGRVHETPQSAVEVESTYDIGFGELRLDLTKVADPSALDGRTIHLDANVGSIEVIVPDRMDVTATGDISGGGEVDIFGESQDGDSPRLTRQLDGGTDVPQLTIDADLDLGSITVRTQ